MHGFECILVTLTTLAVSVVGRSECIFCLAGALQHMSRGAWRYGGGSIGVTKGVAVPVLDRTHVRERVSWGVP